MCIDVCVYECYTILNALQYTANAHITHFRCGLHQKCYQQGHSYWVQKWMTWFLYRLELSSSLFFPIVVVRSVVGDLI